LLSVRRLLVVLIVLGVLLVVADFGARAYAQSKVSAALQESLDVSERPEVLLGGFPFLLGVAQGEVPDGTVEARDFTVESVPIDRLQLTVRQLHFSPMELLSQSGTLRADRGDGTIRLTGEDATRALEQAGIPVRVRFEDGRAFVSSDQIPAELGADVSIEDGRLIFGLTDSPIDISVAITLPEVLPGIEFTDVALDGDLAVLSFSLTRFSLEY
jgi:hypothetical protein